MVLPLFLIFTAYVYGLSYHGPYNPQPYTAQLLTPALYIDMPHCLKLSIFTSVRLRIYQTALSGRKVLLLDCGKGLSFNGKLVSFSINLKPMDEPFYLEFVWTSIAVKDSGYVAAVKAIDLQRNPCNQGTCYQYYVMMFRQHT